MKKEKTAGKIEYGLGNFRKALSRLELFLSTPAQDDRSQAGVIQAFEFTFEQFWKSVQKIAESEGLAAPSPKQALKAGLKLGIMSNSDEPAWLLMLEDRNLTSHTYREDVASRVFENISKNYLRLFRDSENKMDEKTRS